MTYQVLARKWRPHLFEDMIGQAHVVRALRNALDSDRLHHAYLFSGTRGVGKTTVARIFAKAINCERGVSSTPCGECSSCLEIDEGRFVDLIEVDAASRTGVDDTRELMENVQYVPTRGRYKVYLIDEVHMFSKHSFNALLKTLEEPPPHVKFLLATTDPKRLPVTVLSRCLQFNLTRVPMSDLRDHLRRILDSEKVTYDDSSVHAIVAGADGSVRDALSLLDQAIVYGGGGLEGAEVAAMIGSVSGADVHALLAALIARDGAKLIEIARSLADANPDYQSVLGELLSYLRRIAICQVLGDDADSAEEDSGVKQMALTLSQEDCQLYYQIGLIGRRDLPLAPEPQVGFEMILLRMLAFTRIDEAPNVSSTGRKTAVSTAPVSDAAAEDKTTELANDTDWPSLIEELQLTGLVRELAVNCAWVEYCDSTLRLSVDPQFERLHNRNTEQRLADALRARFGSDLKLNIDSSATTASGHTISKRCSPGTRAPAAG